MSDITIQIEEATPENIAPYGHFVGARAEQPVFATWVGTTVFGATPITVERGGELLVVQTDGRSFPVEVGIIERHFLHTQTYLPFNGKPFVMLLGTETMPDGRLPVIEKLRAFRFSDASGIALHKDVWHDFPYAIEPDTQFAVVLSNLSHENTLENPEFPMEAEGPDLERRSIRSRVRLLVSF